MQITGTHPSSVEPLFTGERLERTLREAFDRIAPFTIGAEEEFLLVDALGHAPLPAAERLLAASEGDRRICPELRASQIESVSPICVSVADVQRELASVRRLLAERLGSSGHLVGAGTHPLSLCPGPVSDMPRYRDIARDHPWAAAHTMTCGLHVHVAVGGADRTLAVYNAMRGYLPELIALAANAPIYRGEESGLATVRPKLNQFLPRAGVPPAFGSWRELAEFVVWSRDGEAFPDSSYHWWDMRLNLRHWTIEVRAADTQTSVEDAGSIIALVQSLVYDLATRFDEGEALASPRDERIAENAWLAARDGLSGHLIDFESGRRMRTADRLGGLVDRLLPTASVLGCERELLRVDGMLARGGGAARQLEVFNADGPDGLIDYLAAETVRMPLGASIDELGFAAPALVEDWWSSQVAVWA
jgi:glutamate---cysteine ligase / carboxylate-amine ligase